MDINFMKECFYVKDGVLHWKERPRKHFASEQSWKCTNTKRAHKPAGTLDHSKRDNTTYLRVIVNRKSYLAHRLLFALHHGFVPEIVDHIDGNTLNNSIDNLRDATAQENACNQKKFVTNTSGITGVNPKQLKGYSYWAARIRIKGKRKQLYVGRDFFEACCRRKAAEAHLSIFTERHGK